MLKERIIQQATAFFSLRGVKNVSVDNLASALGISKRTIYKNFENKEDVLKNCILAFQENRNRHIAEILSQADNVVYGCLEVINHYKSISLPTALFWQDIYKYYPDIYHFVHEDAKKSSSWLKQLLDEGIKEKYFRENIDLDAAAFMMDVTAYIKISAVYPESTPSSQSELLFRIMVNMVRGISTDKGIEIVDRYLANIPNPNNGKFSL